MPTFNSIAVIVQIVKNNSFYVASLAAQFNRIRLFLVDSWCT